MSPALPALVREGQRLRSCEPGPTGLPERLPLGRGRLVGLAQVLGGGSDPVSDRLELVEVEPVELRLVEAEDLGRLVQRDVPESILEESAGVGPGALRVWEVVAPHDVAHADLVP